MPKSKPKWFKIELAGGLRLIFQIVYASRFPPTHLKTERLAVLGDLTFCLLACLRQYTNPTRSKAAFPPPRLRRRNGTHQRKIDRKINEKSNEQSLKNRRPGAPKSSFGGFKIEVQRLPRGVWGAFSVSWARGRVLGAVSCRKSSNHGPNLGPKMEAKSLKNRKKNRWTKTMPFKIDFWFDLDGFWERAHGHGVSCVYSMGILYIVNPGFWGNLRLQCGDT